MTVSNSTDFNLSRNKIIELAYKRIGVMTDYRPLTAKQLEDGATLLNVMIKSWISKGDRLWKNKQGTLFVQPNQDAYILDGIIDHATEGYVSSLTSSSVLSGSFIVPVTTSAGMLVGDFFGVVSITGNIFWSTIVSIDGLNITLNNALTSSVNIGSNVYVYTTKIKRPENILNAQCKTSLTTSLPMVIISRDTYRAITIKTNVGIPNRLYYDKQLDSGIIYLWQTPSNANYIINFTWQEQIFNFNTPTNTADFPVEWLEALYLNLAVRLAGFNSVSDEAFLNKLENQAASTLADAEGYDRETTSIYFEPSTEFNTNTYR